MTEIADSYSARCNMMVNCFLVQDSLQYDKSLTIAAVLQTHTRYDKAPQQQEPLRGRHRHYNGTVGLGGVEPPTSRLSGHFRLSVRACEHYKSTTYAIDTLASAAQRPLALACCVTTCVTTLVCKIGPPLSTGRCRTDTRSRDQQLKPRSIIRDLGHPVPNRPRAGCARRRASPQGR